MTHLAYPVDPLLLSRIHKIELALVFSILWGEGCGTDTAICGPKHAQQMLRATGMKILIGYS